MTSRRRDTVAERTLPHNLEAERAVLGAILLHNDAYARIADVIDGADFHRDAHRRIYESMVRLLERPGGEVDLITLKEDLTKLGELDEVGGPVYISALIDGVPRSTNIEHYAHIVKEHATLRRLIYQSNRVITAAYTAEEPAAAILTMADRGIVDLQNDTLGGNMQSLKKSNTRYCELLEERIRNKGALTGLPTGFAKIDAATLGWQRKDSILIAARPSIGKTAFVLNTAETMAESFRPKSTERCHVAFFSMEMRRTQLEDRMLSRLCGIPSSLLRSGHIFGDEQMAQVAAGLGRMQNMNLHIDDTKGRTVFDIRAECRRLQSEHGLDGVIIDYIQLMEGSLARRGATRNEELTDISRRLNVMFGELDVAGIILSQLSRPNENRPDPRPQLKDLRDSGALEQDADLACFLHRRNHKEAGLTHFIIEKARNGPTGTLALDFDRDLTSFKEYEGEPPAEPAPTPVERKSRQRSFLSQRARNN